VSQLSPLLIQQCSSGNLVMQSSTALALGAWLDHYPDQVRHTLDALIDTYSKKKSTPPPKQDSFGRDIFIEYRDQWEERVGVASALEQLSKHAESADAMHFLKFVIPRALSDPSPKVQSAMMAAAQAAIGCHGDTLAGELMAHSEESLKSIPDSQEADVVRQCIIVLMGSLAKHIDKENPKVCYPMTKLSQFSYTGQGLVHRSRVSVLQLHRSRAKVSQRPSATQVKGQVSQRPSATQVKGQVSQRPSATQVKGQVSQCPSATQVKGQGPVPPSLIPAGEVCATFAAEQSGHSFSASAGSHCSLSPSTGICGET
jgi:hypothetical protein